MSLFRTIILTGLFSFIIAPQFASAATTTKNNCPPGEQYKNSVCLKNPLDGDRKTAGEIISTIIAGALSVVGALTLLMLVLGGFRWLTSAGNSEKIEQGTKTMIWAVIGLFLVLASYLILTTFTEFLTTNK